MIYKYDLIDGDIEVGDRVLYGVFYGLVKVFNKKHTMATVDFSNGANEPNLVFPVKLSKLKRCAERTSEVVSYQRLKPH